MPTELEKACLNCSLPFCDDKSELCAFRRLSPPKKQKYTEALARSQKEYRERNEEKYQKLWKEAYKRRRKKSTRHPRADYWRDYKRKKKAEEGG